MSKRNRLLILGANSDMAIGIAREFSEKGFDLALASRDIEDLKDVASDIHIRSGASCDIYYFDAIEYELHESFLSTVGHFDGVVVAFGYMAEQADAQKDFALAKKMVETNYLGAISILEKIAPIFEAKKSGLIVGISSVAGDRGRKTNYLYGSTKAALSTYLSGLRNRLSVYEDIQVLSVKPGFVATKMTQHLELPALLTATPQKVGKDVYNGYLHDKDVIYTKPIWQLIMLIIKLIPEFQFKKMSI